MHAPRMLPASLPRHFRSRARNSRRTPSYRKSRLPIATGSRLSSGLQIESATM